MAFENELKYVLKVDASLEHEAAKQGTLYQIEQKYLAKTKFTLRLRKSLNVKKNALKKYFTFKKTIDGTQVEFEQKIKSKDNESFDFLWDQCNTCIVKKNRYKYKCINDEEWVLDFFYDNNSELYFVMAEVEMPQEKEKPLMIPTVIADNIIYQVDKSDKRFSSKKISDKSYALELYDSLFCAI